MLETLKKKPGSLRWPPRVKFELTEQGKAALVQYREEVAKMHDTQTGRQALDEMEKHWADSHHAQPRDAMVLGELEGKARTPRDVQQALEDCGISLPEVQAAIDRLYVAGLVIGSGGAGPIPPRSQQPPQDS